MARSILQKNEMFSLSRYGTWRAYRDFYESRNRLSREEKDSLVKRFDGVGINDFNSKLVKIADIWFNNIEDDGSLYSLQECFINKRTYGDYKTETVLNAVYVEQTSSNAKYLKDIIFPSANALYNRYDVKHRCFLLLPFLWLKRIFGQLFGSKEKWAFAKQQMDTFKTVDQSNIDYERKIRQDFGLV